MLDEIKYLIVVGARHADRSRKTASTLVTRAVPERQQTRDRQHLISPYRHARPELLKGDDASIIASKSRFNQQRGPSCVVEVLIPGIDPVAG